MTLAEAGRAEDALKQALETLDRSHPSVGTYVAGFAEWCETARAGAFEFDLGDLASVTAIVGWIRQDWAELAASLGAEPDDPP